MANSKLKCKHCRDYFPRASMIKVVVGRFCTKSCMIDWSMQNIEKGRKKIAQYERKKNALEKKLFNDNDKKKQLESTQTAFNKLRRLQEFKWFKDRNIEPYCISCGKTNMDWCTGHFKTIGSHSELRFDPMNTYLQCNRYCNMGLSGNITGTKTTIGYIEGLKKRFGETKAQQILDYCGQTKIKTWECDELILMRAQFNKQIKEIKEIT